MQCPHAEENDVEMPALPLDQEAVQTKQPVSVSEVICSAKGQDLLVCLYHHAAVTCS